MEQKVIQIGNSAGVILPQELRHSLGLSIGNDVIIEPKDGVIIISPKKQITEDIDPKFAQMVDEFMTEHEDVLKELANR